MAELRHQVKKPDLYDRLIDRLGLALDMAKTSVRLRNECPVELELRGLSQAEFQFIEAYLDACPEKKDVVLKEDSLSTTKGSSTTSREPSEPMRAPHPSANVIWLKDPRRANVSAKLRRYSSTKHFKR
jgi:hypothetical protein